ncbi:MAG: 50S ribosomal protein L19e [Candidatus Micrarchaeota archaeon]
MAAKTVKRIASKLLKCGKNRIVLDSSNIKKVNEALTREDVRGLISEGIVVRKKKKGVSRGRAREKHLKKKKGRRRGKGSMKGTKYSRVSKKDMWMSRVRAQRELLKGLLRDAKIERKNYRSLYRMIKGGAFRGRTQLLAHLKEADMLK